MTKFYDYTNSAIFRGHEERAAVKTILDLDIEVLPRQVLRDGLRDYKFNDPDFQFLFHNYHPDSYDDLSPEHRTIVNELFTTWDDLRCALNEESARFLVCSLTGQKYVAGRVPVPPIPKPLTMTDKDVADILSGPAYPFV